MFLTKDIEDCAPGTKSEYFSPIQTRRQRVNYGNPLKPNIIEAKRARKQTSSDAGATNAPTAPANGVKIERSFLSKPNAEGLSDATTSQWEPTHWRQVLVNIRTMRAKGDAQVDTMGCHKCIDNTADEKSQRFHILVALMLSSQTKDETTYDAMQRLLAGGLTPAKIINFDSVALENLLYPVSFYKNKANYLRKTSGILVDNYAADIPRSVEELVALPGVGPKMAHICMATAWNEITGIGVDVHVHRIANRLGWMLSKTKKPEDTRVALEAWLPRELWSEVNHLLVGFGQTTCKPVRPNCKDCLNRDICPAAANTAEKIGVKTALR